MATIKCKMCGGTMEIADNSTVAVCEYCGTQQTIPRISDDRKANLYDRANHFRRNNEFDKAQAIYEQILNEDPNDSESYWSLVLCKYGIEYVEDPATHKRVPTVNRTQFTSVFEDSNYKEAIRLADDSQKAIYEEEAQTIDDIQKGILAISKNEEPFDVFICYKETDDNGKRTRDSVLAQDLYYELKKSGFKVFFSRITLESKLGSAYEPYIFSALNTSKVMVVIGTKPEYFKAVWVRNEWRRFLEMIKKGEKKTLIPAYRDMDPYDLPEEFSFLQALDMAKLGFMQDLVSGIKKIVDKAQKESSLVSETNKTETQSDKKNPLLARAFLFMEDGDFNKAKEYINKVLDQEPQNPMAYLASVMTDIDIRYHRDSITIEDLFDIPESKLKEHSNYKKALRFSNDEFKREYLDKRADFTAKQEQKWKETKAEFEKRFSEVKTLNQAKKVYMDLTAKEIADKWSNRSDYQDLIVECHSIISQQEKEFAYFEASSLMYQKQYLRAADDFRKLGDYKDSASIAKKCELLDAEEKNQEKYEKACNYIKEKKLDDAISILKEIRGFRDSEALLDQCEKKKNSEKQTVMLILLIIVILSMGVYLARGLLTWKSDDYVHWHSIFGSTVGYADHDFILTVDVPPTCTEKGYKEYECKECGRLKSETINPTGHLFDDGVITKEPTCTKSGVKTYTCKVCGTVKTKTVPATGHSFDDGVVIQEQTCTENGVKTYTCKVCGTVKTETVPATGHSSDSGKVIKEPTCTASGTKTYTCTTCGAVIKTESIPAIGHDYSNEYCSRCGIKVLYKIGEKGPAGGFIFYNCDDDNDTGNKDGLKSSECGWRYLEAAPSDIGSFIFGYYKTADNGNIQRSGTGYGIGFGKLNTQILVADMGTAAYTNRGGTTKTENYAARLCDTYSYGGYSDWFLPSKDELNLMYVNLNNAGLGGFANSGGDRYWSSSENSDYVDNAWYQYFSNGSQDYNYRSYTCRVRPVRAF